MSINIPNITLNTGQKFPLVGFGTYKITDQNEINVAIDTALESGYRLFDTALLYKNEEQIGNALKV